mmetsp:Transcript_4607/g.7807  ORF Transcript_4607/g.7807 Transcript_4607/m.7807 type:complete len:242 (+) Transcript_4607:494-1219(+)
MMMVPFSDQEMEFENLRKLDILKAKETTKTSKRDGEILVDDKAMVKKRRLVGREAGSMERDFGAGSKRQRTERFMSRNESSVMHTGLRGAHQNRNTNFGTRHEGFSHRRQSERSNEEEEEDVESGEVIDDNGGFQFGGVASESQDRVLQFVRSHYRKVTLTNIFGRHFGKALVSKLLQVLVQIEYFMNKFDLLASQSLSISGLDFLELSPDFLTFKQQMHNVEFQSQFMKRVLVFVDTLKN